jgi:hypothetical protein
MVDGIDAGGHGRFLERLETPPVEGTRRCRAVVVWPLRPPIDPEPQRLDLDRAQALLRGHRPILVLAGDELKEQAIGCLAGHERLGRVCLAIKSQAILLLLGAMARNAMLGKDRLDVAVEVDGSRFRRRRRLARAAGTVNR